MNVLVACEESQRVCMAFREKGHNAFSCDIQECSGGHPEWHIRDDVLFFIAGNCKFKTSDGSFHQIDGEWDMLIAHPPCTYLTVSGNVYFNEDRYGEKARRRKEERLKAAEFFMLLANAKCPRIAIENPIGYMNTHYRKPDQIIQPYQFGHPFMKTTCLWLKELPKLEPTNILQKPKNGWKNQQITKDGRYGGFGGSWCKDENGKWLRYTDPRVAKERSKTFPGIAQAMADQWG